MVSTHENAHESSCPLTMHAKSLLCFFPPTVRLSRRRPHTSVAPSQKLFKTWLFCNQRSFVPVSPLLKLIVHYCLVVILPYLKPLLARNSLVCLASHIPQGRRRSQQTAGQPPLPTCRPPLLLRQTHGSKVVIEPSVLVSCDSQPKIVSTNRTAHRSRPQAC